MTFWLGIMKIAEKSGIVEFISKLLKPAAKLLFPEIPPNSPVIGDIAMNFSANALGLANAATPIGIKAMEGMQKMNIDPGKFSQYLPKDIIQLSPEAKKEADNITKELTGLSLEDGKEISRRLPGSQKKDAINLVKILSGRKEAPKSFTPKQNINTARAQLMSKRDQGR